MNKDLVPYQPSIDIKELGFDEPCFVYWVYDGVEITYSTSHNKSGWSIIGFKNSQMLKKAGLCTSPTFSQAFRWFREKHNLMFQIFYLRNGNYAVLIHRTTPEYMDLIDQVNPSSGCVDEVVDCYSYEEAELECLLKLIEIVKQQKQ